MKKLSLFLIAVVSAGFWHGLPGGGGGATLTSPLAIADGTDHAQIQVQTNTGSGTLYYIVSQNCTPPSVVQIQAGHDQGGGTPSPGAAGNQVVSATGKQNANPAGTIAAIGTYCAFFQQHTAGGDSIVAAAPSFVTPGAITFTFSTSAAWDAAQGGTFNAVVTNFKAWFEGCFTAKTNATMYSYLDYNSSVCSGGCGGITTPDMSGAFYDTQLRPALQGLPNQNTIQQQQFGNLPATDPTGLTNSYSTSCNQAAVIGTNIGTCTRPPLSSPGSFGSTTLNPGMTYDTTVNGTGNVGFSVWGTLWHETTENMGRISGIQVSGPPNSFDLLRYTAPGVRALTIGTGIYVSHDSGSTTDISSNTLQNGDTGGDEIGATQTYFLANPSGVTAFPVLVDDIKVMTDIGFGLTHSCRVTYGFTNLNWLLKRDVAPAANDNMPVGINLAA